VIPRARLGIVVFADRLSVVMARSGKVLTNFVVSSAENPAAALRAELATRRLRGRRARLGLARNLVTVKPLELPATSEADVRQMVQFEIDRHVPYGAEETAFDFVPLSTADGRRRVLVVAAERRLVDRALRVATDGRLRPVAVTVATHDLASLLARGAPRRAVWAHRAGEVTDLLVLNGRTVLLSRSLPAVEGEALAAEIRATLALLRWDTYNALWISGDDADRHLASPAIRALGISSGPPLLSAVARRALSTSRDTLDGSGWLATAVALGRGRRRLNLLPLALRPRRLKVGHVLTVALVVITTALGITTAVMQGLRDEERLAKLETEIRRLDSQVTSIERLRKELERRRKLLAIVLTAETGGLQPLPILRELTDTLPPDAWLTTLSLDQNGVEMTGQAAAASTLIPLLENSPRLERVEFASPVTRGRDKEQFRIKAVWETPTPATSGGSAKSPPVSPVVPSPGFGAVPGAPAVATPGMPAAPPTSPVPTAPSVRVPRPVPSAPGPILPLPGANPRPQPGANDDDD